MGWFLKLSILTLLIHINVAVYLIPKQPITEIGASYTVMLVDDDENIKPKQCFLTAVSKYVLYFYEIDLTTSGVPLKFMNESSSTSPSPVEENTNFMTSLGNGICGFKLDNVGKNYVTRWNISFVDENETLYFKDTNVILKDIKYKNETTYVTIGDSISIKCGDDLIPQFQYFNCKLYDPQGTLVLSSNSRIKCAHNIKISKMSDYGAWKCILYLENNMSPKEIYYNIVEKGKTYTTLWQNETNTHVNIGCSIKNFVSLSDENFCEMTRPDGESFSFKEGFATDRYTALGTNISKRICGMEIKKPLEEFEKGLWRCEYKYPYLENRYPAGGFINVSSEASTLPPPEIPKKIITLVRNSLSISCKVAFSSSYCYMQGPNKNGNGTIYPVEDFVNPAVGLCKFTKEQASMEDNGLWYCGFAQKTGEADALYAFQVVVMEKYNVKPEKEDVESTRDGAAYLKCSTEDLGDAPVQYCRFKNPHGQIYNINPEENSTNRMSYYGRGLNYGDCGVEIKNVTFSDAGPWTCITRIGNSFENSEIYSQINLRIK